MEIHENIKALIEDTDTEIQDLAEIIGVNRKQIQRWENGSQEMGIYKLKKICEFYQVSADYILGLPKGLSWPR